MKILLVKKLIFLTTLFMYIYSPPFRLLPFNVSIMIAVFAYAHIFMCGRVGEILDLFKIELIIFFLISAYSLAISIYFGGFGFTDSFVILFFNLPVCFWLFYFFKNVYGGEVIYEKFVKVLGLLAAFSSFCSIALWLNQDLGNYVKFELLKYDRDLMVHQMHRGFGLSDELLFSYSLVQGCILLLVLACYGMNRFTAILTALVFFSISLNARIGFVLFALILALPTLWRVKNIYLVLFVVFCGAFFNYFFEWGEVISFSVKQFVYFFNDFLGADDNYNTLSVLFGDMFFFPQDAFGLIFGSGENIFYRASGGSDVGYIIILHYGGLIYFVLILILFLSCFARGLLMGSRVIPISIITFMVFFASFKGLVFAPKPGSHIFFLVYIFLVLSNCYNRFNKQRLMGSL